MNTTRWWYVALGAAFAACTFLTNDAGALAMLPAGAVKLLQVVVFLGTWLLDSVTNTTMPHLPPPPDAPTEH